MRIAGAINTASDTSATIERRRGGSAANVAMSIVAAGGHARFIGRVGDDAIGSALIDAMVSAGVDMCVQREGRSGTVVVIVGADGERTMFPDRGASAELDDPDAAWLDGLDALHVPLYSLLGTGGTARTSRALIEEAHRRGMLVSVDASSVGLIGDAGVRVVLDVLRSTTPAVLFANADEAAALGAVRPPKGVGMLVVKRGPEAASVVTATATIEVAAPSLVDVRDTTGAGDSFAAGFLVEHLRAYDPVGSTHGGHAAAAAALQALGARRFDPETTNANPQGTGAPDRNSVLRTDRPTARST